MFIPHRCAFSNCQHIHEPGCCVREDFDRHSIYVELYHEVKQNEDLERHRSMSKKVGAHAILASWCGSQCAVLTANDNIVHGVVVAYVADSFAYTDYCSCMQALALVAWHALTRMQFWLHSVSTDLAAKSKLCEPTCQSRSSNTVLNTLSIHK